LKSSHDRPIWRPYTQEKTARPPIEIARAEGAYLFTKAGQKIFDGISSWWVITHGHCHPEIVEAIRTQAGCLDQVTFADFTHEPAEELADLLIQITPPELTRVFFTDNGSTAVEAALKMALQACAQNGRPERQKFLAFEGAYHGDTVGAMSVSAASSFNRPYKKSLFEILRAKHPTSSRASAKEYLRDFGLLIEEHHQTLAGVIIEPLVQGAGGMIVWPDEAVKEIAKYCKTLGVYLIFDEVMTGFGRTGKMFAMDRLSVAPDLVCLSKGLTGGSLPLAVTLAREDVFQAFLSREKSQQFFHGHSFTGNPVSCAAAVANIKLFAKSNVLENIERLNEIHREQFKLIENNPFFSDPRVCGTMAAFNMTGNEPGYLNPLSSRLTDIALQGDLFIRPLGTTVYLMPPFCSQPRDLENSWNIVRESVTQLGG